MARWGRSTAGDDQQQVTTGPSTGQAPGGVRGRMLEAAVESALSKQQPLVAARIAAFRRKRPESSPAEIVEALGRSFQLTVAATGGIGGAIAILPTVGTVASLATAGAEAIAALDAGILYVLAVAEIHALPTEAPERRRALVLGVVLGESGQAVLRKVTGKSSDWAQDVTNTLPLTKLGPLNSSLSRWFIKRYIVRQSVLAVGRALPMGIGVAIGAIGNVVIARAVIRAAERAFGPAPTRWSDAGGPTPLQPQQPVVTPVSASPAADQTR